MNAYKSLAAVGFALLLLGGCGSLGDLLPGTVAGASAYEIEGTVSSVDPSNRSVLLTNVTDYDNRLTAGGNTVRVYYDNETTVDWQGQTYRPDNLERGDRVRVQVEEADGRLIADRMTVTHNVSAGVGSSTDMATIRGSVRSVDTSRRLLQLETVSWMSGFAGGSTGNTTTLQYDVNTRVEVAGSLYPVANLERGDVIDVRVQNPNSVTPIATHIILVRDVRQ